MVDRRLAGIRIGAWTVVCLGLLGCFAPRAASAADCPGHPDALGTSRTLVVDPREHPRIGAMQYPETLPLRDHEVVLTFDDGPLPRNSNQILQILADQCVKATFFLIGQQARANPEGVRRYVAAGHSIGSHSQNHPLTFKKMSAEQAQQEIEAGVASITAALSDPTQLAPFFRIPGLERGEPAEQYAASRGLQIWSADFLADDWRHIPSSRVFDLAIKRLEARGKGILLLHDIQARTVAALPRILHELKVRGYRIVHVVPAMPQQPATATERAEWLTHPSAEAVAALDWPKIPSFVFTRAGTLPAPALADFNSPDGALLLSGEPFDHAKQRGVPTPRAAPWPHVAMLPAENTVPTLPVPAASLFTVPDTVAVALRPLPPYQHHADQAAAAVQERTREAKAAATDAIEQTARARRRLGHAAHPIRHAMHGPRRSLKVASLKKR
jgi:peptidoglycan/xylan/chitin deacetylase (PgdA/CDA1 family)